MLLFQKLWLGINPLLLQTVDTTGVVATVWDNLRPTLIQLGSCQTETVASGNPDRGGPGREWPYRGHHLH